MPRRPSIRLLAPLFFGIPVLLVGLWLSVMWNRQSHRAVTDLAEQNIGQIHDTIATKIAGVLSMPVRVCELNEHLVESKALDPADLSTWRDTFVRESRSFDMLSSIVWGSADGRCAWVTRYSDGGFYWALKDDPSASTMNEWRIGEDSEISSDPTSTFEFELSARPWFRTPVDAKRATWCEPFVWVGGVDSEGHTLGISYGIPLYTAGGELLGVVDADYSLNDLSRFLSTLEIGKTGVAVLATPDGNLIAASNETPIIDSEGNRVEARKSPDPRVAAAATYFGDGANDANRMDELQVNGETQLIRASDVGEEAGLQWTLITIIPQSDFTGDIESEFRRSSVASLIAVAIAIALGVLAARWLVAPLLKLVLSVRRIGQGDLETRVKIRHTPEYENLASEINKMAIGLQDRMRMQKSLSLAMEVQRNLLPSEAPTIKGLDIAGHSTYCDETGGDYYDFLDVSDADKDTAVIVIGDVMGHGVAAALLMATARGILRSRCAEQGSLADFLEHINEMLVVDTQGERFMTMLLVTLAGADDELRWASAGHGPPVIYDPSLGGFPELEGGGLPLGLMEGEGYTEYVYKGIKPGSIILVATDGLSEMINEAEEQYGEERLLILVKEHADRTADEISEVIRQSLAEFRGPRAQDDDLTFVVAKVI